MSMKPAHTTDDDDELKCGYCGMGNDPNVRGSGGEYHEITSAVSIAGVTNVTNPDGDDIERQNDDSGGCAFCGSTEWIRGGTITWGKLRPGRR